LSAEKLTLTATIRLGSPLRSTFSSGHLIGIIHNDSRLVMNSY